jgi:hypothetical protein
MVEIATAAAEDFDSISTAFAFARLAVAIVPGDVARARPPGVGL